MGAPRMSVESSGPTVTVDVEEIANVQDVSRTDDDEMNIFEHGVIGGPISGAVQSAQRFSEGMSYEE